MSTIERYISDLLHFHDCVIVPGLGGFVANYKPAVILEDRNMFLPPAKEIGFNRSLSHNDGLLIDFIARRERITYAEASVLVTRFVDDAHKRIGAGQIVDLGDTGLLRRDAIGNLQFTPNDTASFLPDALGLTSFRFEPLETKKVVRIDIDQPVPRLLRSRSPRYWAAAAALIAGLFLFNTELKMPEVNQAGIGSLVVPSTYFDNAATATSDSEANTQSVSSDAIDNSMEAEYQVTAADLPGYHIIVASFKQSVPANKALDGFLRKGFSDAKLLDDGQGRIRVAVSSYINKEEALNALNDFRQQPGFEGAWVFAQ